MTSTTGSLKIHTENILPIIKKWLYTDRDIFVRELISNGCDAIAKMHTLRNAGETNFKDKETRIDVTIDKENKTLTFSDSGIGMTAEEVEKYIANVAFSSAEAFMEKYQKEGEGDHIIGHFGLGFFSAYIVAKHVTVDTLSYKEGATAALWSCDGSVDYTLDTGTRKKRGTTITLTVDDENADYLEEARLKQILTQHCSYLPYPIFLEGTQINGKDPLWLKSPSETTDKEYLEFYRDLYPFEPDPIFWVHLNVDYPFNLKGILYFPKISPRHDWSKTSVKLFCNRVFVSDHCKDILPDYLTMLRGAIDSPDIPLNVSRSSLQMDRTVRQLGSHIAKKVTDRLTTLQKTDSKKYEEIWPDIDTIVKLGILQDEKFYEKVKPALIFKTTEGSYTTLDAYIEGHKDKTSNKVYYTSDAKLPSHIADLYKQKGIDIVLTTSPVDTTLMSFLEQKLTPTTFQRLDGALDETFIDASKEKTLLDADGKSVAANMASFFKETLPEESYAVEAKSLASDSLPALIVFDEHARRMREHFALRGEELPSSVTGKKIFVVNTNSKLINAIYALKGKDPELAKEMTAHLLDLTLLGQKEITPDALSTFVTRTTHILEKLTEK